MFIDIYLIVSQWFVLQRFSDHGHEGSKWFKSSLGAKGSSRRSEQQLLWGRYHVPKRHGERAGDVPHSVEDRSTGPSRVWYRLVLGLWARLARLALFKEGSLEWHPILGLSTSCLLGIVLADFWSKLDGRPRKEFPKALFATFTWSTWINYSYIG